MIYFFVHVKTSYYQLKRERLLEKAKDSYHKDCGK